MTAVPQQPRLTPEPSWPTDASLQPFNLDQPPDAQPPEFPLHALPPVARNLCVQISRTAQYPVDYPAVGCLAVAASAIGATRQVQIRDNWVEPSVLYVGIIGAPGQGKSPALSYVKRPLEAAQRESLREQQGGDTSRPGQVTTDSIRHYLVNDSTLPALGGILANNPRGVLLFQDELTAWLRRLNGPGGGSDRAAYLSLWSRETIKVDRGRNQATFYIPDPTVNILGGIQPDLLGELRQRGNLDDGFLDRWLFSYPLSHGLGRWTTGALDPAVQANWDRAIRRLLEIPLENETGVLQLSGRALEKFQEYYDWTAGMAEDQAGSQLSGLLSKSRACCARLALVIRMLRWASAADGDSRAIRVGVSDVTAAIDLVRYFLGHRFRITHRLSESTASREVRQMLAWMERKRIQTCTPRDLCRAEVAKVKNATHARKILREAAEQGYGYLDCEMGDQIKAFHRSLSG